MVTTPLVAGGSCLLRVANVNVLSPLPPRSLSVPPRWIRGGHEGRGGGWWLPSSAVAVAMRRRRRRKRMCFSSLANIPSLSFGAAFGFLLLRLPHDGPEVITWRVPSFHPVGGTGHGTTLAFLGGGRHGREKWHHDPEEVRFPWGFFFFLFFLRFFGVCRFGSMKPPRRSMRVNTSVVGRGDKDRRIIFLLLFVVFTKQAPTLKCSRPF